MASGDKHAISFTGTDLGVTNNDSASNGDVLLSNGDETSTYTDPDDLGFYPYTTATVTGTTAPSLNDYTDAGIYCFQGALVADDPDNRSNADTNLILTVKKYLTGSGVQILQNARGRSDDIYNNMWMRTFTGSTFTSWYSIPMYSADDDPSQGNILVSTGQTSNFEYVPYLRFLKEYSTEEYSLSTGWNLAVDFGTASLNNFTNARVGYNNGDDYVSVGYSGVYRITLNLSGETTAGGANGCSDIHFQF